MKKYDYLIVGAGISGAVFAERMLLAGKKCLIIDRRNHIGGNVYTEEIEGIQVHRYGPHVFHTDSKEIWDYVSRFAEFNHYINCPVANYKGKIYSLPFNMQTFNSMWGVTAPDEARKIIAEQVKKSGITCPRNLEEQAVALVGTDLYETLIKGYTEKQWGRPCRDLPSDIIKRIPVRFTYNNNYYNDRYQGIPIGGYTSMIRKMIAGADLCLGTDYLQDRRSFDSLANRVFYTGPVDAFFDYSLGALEYRSLAFETEILDTDNYQGTAIMNYTDRETPFTRIIEHKHFEFGTQPKTVISREYPGTWRIGEEPYYPVCDEKNNLLYAAYSRQFPAYPHVLFGGRLGAYRYLDMDDAIAEALTLAAEELGKKS